MKKCILIFLFVVVIGGPLVAAGGTTFDAVMEHYEPIRLALLGDSMNGVNEHGKAIAAELRSLAADYSAVRSGASDDAATIVEEKLDEMIAAADVLATATTLEVARDGIYALTKPMVRWRQGVAESSRPAVAYCPMYKRSWLQPEGQIGNPYGGMPRCGEIVSKESR